MKDINVGVGKLALVLIGNYEKGGTFTQGYDSAGNIINLTNPLHTDAAWGIGGVDNLGNSKVVSGRVHDVQFGTRPTAWLTDNIALQGQFSGNWESNNINGSGYAGFGKPGWLGVFDVGPVIKPKGGYYTKPELRFFATYAIWSDSLKGMTTPAQENGTDWMPPYNGNTNHGWLFGTQVEWF